MTFDVYKLTDKEGRVSYSAVASGDPAPFFKQGLRVEQRSSGTPGHLLNDAIASLNRAHRAHMARETP